MTLRLKAFTEGNSLPDSKGLKAGIAAGPITVLALIDIAHSNGL